MRAAAKILPGLAIAWALASGCEVVSGIGGYEIRTGTTTRTSGTTSSGTSTTTGAGGSNGGGGGAGGANGGAGGANGGAGGGSVPGGNCGDGVLNDDEADVDCGGRCLPDLPCGPGWGCVVTEDCAEGHKCMSGVCCRFDVACVDQCTACIGELTGKDDGVCAPILAGMPDENDAHNGGACDVCDGGGLCE